MNTFVGRNPTWSSPLEPLSSPPWPHFAPQTGILVQPQAPGVPWTDAGEPADTHGDPHPGRTQSETLLDANTATRPATTPHVCCAAVLFDMDGVLADTAELHYHSWEPVAAELGIPFDRRVNDRLRGLSRADSLAVLLGGRPCTLTADDRTRYTSQKNAEYLRLVAQMTPAHLLPGASDLLRGLRASGARIAVASSSRNANRVLDRLGIKPLLDVIVDGNTARRSKPDPEVFLAAADQLGVRPSQCVVLEDAEAGVAAALAAGMRVVGIGPFERLRGAHLVVGSIAKLDAERVLGLLGD